MCVRIILYFRPPARPSGCLSVGVSLSVCHVPSARRLFDVPSPRFFIFDFERQIPSFSSALAVRHFAASCEVPFFLWHFLLIVVYFGVIEAFGCSAPFGSICSIRINCGIRMNCGIRDYLRHSDELWQIHRICGIRMNYVVRVSFGVFGGIVAFG